MSELSWPFTDDRFYYVVCTPSVAVRYADNFESWITALIVDRGLKMRPVMIVPNDLMEDDEKVAVCWEFGVMGFLELNKDEDYDA